MMVSPSKVLTPIPVRLSFCGRDCVALDHACFTYLLDVFCFFLYRYLVLGLSIHLDGLVGPGVMLNHTHIEQFALLSSHTTVVLSSLSHQFGIHFWEIALNALQY